MSKIDLVAELAAWLREYGRANVLEDNAPNESYKGKDYTAVFEFNHGSPFGRWGVNFGTQAHNIQLRERRKTRGEAYAACNEIRALWDRGAEEKTVSLAAANVLANPTSTVRLMQRDAGGFVCYCEFTFSCPS